MSTQSSHTLRDELKKKRQSEGIKTVDKSGIEKRKEIEKDGIFL
mgnify:CR=1 FL=1